MLRIQKKQYKCDVHSHTTNSLPIQSLGRQWLHIIDQGREDRYFYFSSLFNTCFILVKFFKDIMSKYP